MKKWLALFIALCLTGVAWAQKGLPTDSVPYSGGPRTQGWLSVGPCNANQAVGWAITGGVPQCLTVSGGSGGGGGGGGGGINGISAGITPTSGFGNLDVIATSNGVVWDSGLSYLSVGTVQSVSASCAGVVTNGAITTVGTIAIVDLETSTITANTTITPGNCGNTIRLSGSTPITFTIPGAGTTSFGPGFYFDACNFSNIAPAIISPSAGTIGGLTSYTLTSASGGVPYCTRVLYGASNAWDLKFPTPTVGIAQISAGTTLVGNVASGRYLTVVSGVLSSATQTFTISAGFTATQGISSGDIIGSSSNVAVDTGVPYANVGQLSANQTWSGLNTFSGTFNSTGTFQVGGITYTFSGSGPDTVATFAMNNAFTGNNSFAGSSTFNGPIITGVSSGSAATQNLTSTSKYFLCLDATSNAITVNLPGSPTTGLTFLIKDCTGHAGSNNITVTPATGNIDGSGTFVMNTNYQSIAVTYTGSQWSIN